MRLTRALLPAVLVLPAALASTGVRTLADLADSCGQLAASVAIDNVQINFVEYLPAGSQVVFSQDYDLASCKQVPETTTVDLCRVAAYVATSETSGVTFEAWLPTNWTGRFLSTGNGGVSGCIQYHDINYASGLGFATVGTNNGHNGTSGYPFLNNPEVIRDFADRAMHTGVVVGKQIAELYYGTAHRKSYYIGCSTGGRQGFKAAQKYPEDFDGVVAGCPALNFVSLLSASARFYTIFGNQGDATFVDLGLWRGLIAPEVLRQCDGLDGVVDGIIEDPDLCRFRPEALQCPSLTSGLTAGSCLTKEQVGAVSKVYTDYYGVDGELIFPRMQPGAERLASVVYYTPGPFSFSQDWFRYVVYNDSTWDPASYTINDAKVANDQNPFDIATWSGDLSAFEQAGGKLLTYHGLQDGLITSDNSRLYYDLVSRTMGKTSAELDEFYRFFKVPGLGHCSGGAGANLIGNQRATFSSIDSQSNVLMRMVDWVENGNAPDTIRGTKYVNSERRELGVELVRDHCRYPKRNTCIDPANYKKPEAWKCV